jgi:hypothetical protein
MPNKNIFIYNHLTGTEITREMTNEEQAAFDETTKNNLAIAKEEKQKQELLKENKISAYTKLGLTQAEIEALIPAPLTIVPLTT